MHLIHRFAFALSALAMVLLVVALPMSWYSAHAAPSKSRAIGPYAHATDVDVSLWNMDETHHNNFGQSKRLHATWQHRLARSHEYGRQAFCPAGSGSRTSNSAAHSQVSLTSALAIVAAILCQAYIVFGLLYAMNRVSSRAPLVVIGMLTAVCAIAAVAVWAHFLSLCGDHQCARIGSGSNPAEDYRIEDYIFNCNVGLGCKLELLAPALIILSMVLFAVKRPKGAVTYEAVAVKAEFA